MISLHRLIKVLLLVLALSPRLPLHAQDPCRLYREDAKLEYLEPFVKGMNPRHVDPRLELLFQKHTTLADGTILERIGDQPDEEAKEEISNWSQCVELPSDATIMMQGVTYEGDPVCAVKLSELGKHFLILPGAAGPLMSVQSSATAWTIGIAQPSKLPDGTYGYALVAPRRDRESSPRNDENPGAPSPVDSSRFYCTVPGYATVRMDVDAAGSTQLEFEGRNTVGNICTCPRGFLDFLNDSRKSSLLGVIPTTDDLSAVCSDEGCLSAYKGISELQFASFDKREGYYVDSIQFTQRPDLGLWFPSTSGVHQPFNGCFSRELKYTPLGERGTFSNDDKKALLNEAEYYYTLSQVVTAKAALKEHIESSVIAATKLTESDIFDPKEFADSYEMVEGEYQRWLLASRPKPTKFELSALDQLNSTFIALVQSIELNSAIKDLQRVANDLGNAPAPSATLAAWTRYRSKSFPDGAVEPVDWYEALFLGICPAPATCRLNDAQRKLALAITDKQSIIAKHFNSLPWIAQIREDKRYKQGEDIPRNEVKFLALRYLQRYLNAGYAEDKRLYDDYDRFEDHLKCPQFPNPKLSRPLEELILNLPPRLPLTETILPEAEATRLATKCREGDLEACQKRDYLKKRYAVERIFENIRFRRETLVLKVGSNRAIEATGKVIVLAIAGNYLSAGMAMVAPRAISAVIDGVGMGRGLSQLVSVVGRSVGWTAEKNVLLLKGLALAGYGTTMFGAGNAIYQSVSECDEIAKTVTNDDTQTFKAYFSCVEAKQAEVANYLMPAIGLKRLRAGQCGGMFGIKGNSLSKKRSTSDVRIGAKSGFSPANCGLVTTSPAASSRIKPPPPPRAFLQAAATNLTFSSAERKKLLQMVREGKFGLPTSTSEAEKALGSKISNSNGTYYWDSISPNDQVSAKIALQYISAGVFEEIPEGNAVVRFLRRKLTELIDARAIPAIGASGVAVEKLELVTPRGSKSFDSIYIQQRISMTVPQQITDASGTRIVRYTYTLRWHTKDPSAVGVNNDAAYYKVERTFQSTSGKATETFVPGAAAEGSRGTWATASEGGRQSAAAHIRAELEELTR